MRTIIKIYKDGSRKGYNALGSIDVPDMFSREKNLSIIQILFKEDADTVDALEFERKQFRV